MVEKRRNPSHTAIVNIPRIIRAIRTKFFCIFVCGTELTSTENGFLSIRNMLRKPRFYGYLLSFNFGSNFSKLSFISVTFKIQGLLSRLNFYFDTFAQYFGQTKLNLIRD